MSSVVTFVVEEGAKVEAGQQIGTIEAMKMESAIRAPSNGTVEPGDLLVVLETG